MKDKLKDKQEIIIYLESLGLEKTSAEIYLYLHQNTGKSVLEIARSLELNRNKVYRALAQMKQLYLVEEIVNASGRRYSAADIENIELLIESEQTELDRKKKLAALMQEKLVQSTLEKSGPDFEIKFYEGESGMKQMLWNQLSVRDKSLLAFGYKTRNEIVGREFAEKVRLEQIRRGIKLLELENYKDQKNLSYTNIKDWFDYYEPKHIPEEKFKITQLQVIYDNVVSLIDWNDEEYSGLEIISPRFAEMQRGMFWQFWNEGQGQRE